MRSTALSLAGEVPEMELGALLIAMRIKAEAPEELLGFYQAMQEQVMALQPPASRPPPIVIPSYNGARKQANLTPLLALARLGFPVVVHNVTDDPGRVTSGNIFRELGINGVTSRDAAQAALDRQSDVVWIPVTVLSPPLDRQLSLRWRWGCATAPTRWPSWRRRFHPIPIGGFAAFPTRNTYRASRDFLALSTPPPC